MKKFFEILLVILLFPLILMGLIFFCFYCLFEAIGVRHTAYFKKNKLRLKEEYYYGIATDPVFKIKNLICKYDLEYDVISTDEEKVHLVVNKNNECVLIYIRMKNFYCKNDKLFFQEDTDEGKVVQVDEYLESIKLDNYNYESYKLLVLKGFVSKEDYETISNNPNIMFIKEVNKKIFNIA